MFKRFTASFSAIASAAVAALSLFAGLPSAGAQTDSIRVRVPFAFEAGGKQFVPGMYTIRMDEFTHLMIISGQLQSGQVMFLPDVTLEPAGAGKIVFHRYGAHYFLREIWVESSKTHLHTLPAKAEKQLQLAANAAKTPESRGEELALTQMPH